MHLLLVLDNSREISHLDVIMLNYMGMSFHAIINLGIEMIALIGIGP